MKKKLNLPIDEKTVEDLQVGDMVLISGTIFCGRDAVLPKIVGLYRNHELEQNQIDLKGSLIFHTAVSVAGVGPTTSNKEEIEGNIPALSEAGVRIHLGKGGLKQSTVDALERYHSVYAVIPPVTALLASKTSNKRVVAFPELGMEAFFAIDVVDYPAVIAAAHGKSLYD